MTLPKHRKTAIRISVLRYLADHMRAVLDVDPGPRNIATTDKEEAYLVNLVEHEAGKLEDLAGRVERRSRSKRGHQ